MSDKPVPFQPTPEFEALCGEAKSRISEVSVDDVDAMLKSGDDFYLIDVRDQDEFQNVHIESALSLSKGWAEAKIHTVVQGQDDKIVLYCGGGHRSALVADNLQKMGYGNVHSMAGGIKGWMKSDKAVVKP